MPTRQTTPGPSTLTPAADVLQPHNAKKRTVSEIPPDDEPRQSKKHRKDLEIPNGDDKAVATANSPKDSKKKRKKRKKKSPLTFTIPETDSGQVTQASARAQPDAVMFAVASSSTLSESSLPSPVVKNEQMLDGDAVLRAESLVNVTEGEERPTLSAADKGKGRAISENPDNLISQDPVAGPSQETDSMKIAQAKIAELTAQLQSQKSLVSRHEDNLSHLQQSLTCEICLDLLYKPFALSPCGHVACYLCLIRWFTSVQNVGANDQNNANPPAEVDDVPRLLNSRAATRGAFLRNRKSCPLCRASITSRPAEVWSIKSMVANLIKSKLVEPPSAPPPSATETPDTDAINNHRNDPWRNVFPKSRHQHPHHPPQFYPPPPENNEGGGEWGIEDMGMYDAEDGGIYRCLDCMHEIWGGVCTNCNREYRGHARFDDDDDDDEDDADFDDGVGGYLGGNVLGRRLREIIQGYHEPLGWGPEDDEDEEDEDDEDIDMGEFYDAHGDPMELTDDESSSDDDSQGLHTAGEEWTTDEEDDEEVEEEGEEPGHAHGGPYGFRDYAFWPAAMLPGMQNRREIDPPAPAGRIVEVEDDDDDDEPEEEEEDDSGSDHSHPDSEIEYENDFIDDGEEDHEHDHGEEDEDEDEVDPHHGGGWGRDRRFADIAWRALLRTPRPPLYLREQDDNNDDDDHADPRIMARRLGRGMRLGGAGAGDPLPPPLPPPARRNRNRRHAHNGRREESPIEIVDNDDDEEEEDEDVVEMEAFPPERQRRARPRRGRRVAVIDIDDEDEDDDVGEGQQHEEEEDEPRARANRARRRYPGAGRRGRRVLYDDDDDEEEESE